jgi:N-acetylglucosaminyldiphosphoundecaprenol N-acetyl-beta-D-mannosaminyltransferase
MKNEYLNIQNPAVSMLGGWPHVRLTRKEFAELMTRDCLLARVSDSPLLPKLAFSMNGQALSLAATDQEFSAAMNQADYIQADGQSLVIASKYLCKNPLPEKIPTTDFFHDAAEIAQRESLRFYILGSSVDENKKAIASVKLKYPDLNIVGHRDGYFNAADEDAICQEIVSSGADVLWLGLGKPKEQLFCIRNKEKLRGVGWIKTCGGLFDFLSDKNSRAPEWMQNSGLEWLYRTIQEPRRLFWRYLTTNVHTIYLLLKTKKLTK